MALALPGGSVKLSALEDRPVVLNFFATYCEPCVDEMPFFKRAAVEYGDAIRIVAITNEGDHVARTWMRDRGYGAIPLVEDPNDTIWNAWSMTPIPVTVVVAPSGKVTALRIGGLNYEQLRAAIASAGGFLDHAARP